MSAPSTVAYRRGATSTSQAAAQIFTSELAYFHLDSKLAVFIITYLAYVFMKIANKSFSLVQPILVSEEWFKSPVFKSSYTGQTEMVGLISTLFLSCYAAGQFFVGVVADNVELRHFLTFAMCLAGILTMLFGSVGLLGYRDLWLYCILWSLNGLAQACGWPTTLSVMNNWFGKSSRGLIMSAWSSNSNIGNVVGSFICGFIFWKFDSIENLWQVTMFSCGMIAILGALPVFFCLVPDPDLLASSARNSALRGSLGQAAITSNDREVESNLRQDKARVYENDTVRHNSALGTIIRNSSSNVVTDADAVHEQSASLVSRVEDDKEQYFLGFEGVDDHDSEKMSALSAEDSDDASATREARVKASRSAPLMQMFSSVCQGLAQPNVLAYAIIYACVKGVVYIYIYWMPMFLTSSKGMSNSMAAYISTLFDIGAFAGAITSGYLTDLMRSRTLVLFCLVVLGTMFPFLLFDGPRFSDASNGILLFLIGTSIGAVQVLISASVALDLGDSGSAPCPPVAQSHPVAEQSIEPCSTSGGDLELPSVNSNIVESSADLSSDVTVRASTYSVPLSRESSSSKKLSGTISGIIEGSGSAGAALLQYLVGILLTCEDAPKEKGGSVPCSWSKVFYLITAANAVAILGLMYVKFSGRISYFHSHSS
jgi:sugar phosphate permease